MILNTPTFEETLAHHQTDIGRRATTTLQINMGKLCNLACHHCHVEAGPKRTEVMTRRTIDRILELLDHSPAIQTLDLTGGAPELNPDFRYFVSALRMRRKQVIDRCNLTVLYETGQELTAEFLAAQGVQVVASLPCYSKANVEKQRGKGVFDRSIEALKQLNALGYAQPETDLALHLVYNPGGPFLPPSQTKLTQDYRRELGELFGIQFTSLFTITNMPIKRFLHQLERDGKYREYMELLVDNFSPAAADGIMCRELISVGWDGQLYDCDFNQMLEMPLATDRQTLWDIASFDRAAAVPIRFGAHCYGCTAGVGSSCTGSITELHTKIDHANPI